MTDPANWVPMRWPASWTDPRLLDLLKGTLVNCLVVEAGAESGALKAVVDRGRRAGFAFPEVTSVQRSKIRSAASSPGVAFTGNVWPSIKLSEQPKKKVTNPDRVEAGPTGVPWVDSNGWFVRLARTLLPGKPVWIAAEPPGETAPSPESYALAVADAAAYGGRWVVTLDAVLARGLAAGKPAERATWKRIAAALSFFEGRQQWQSYEPQAVLGVLSDFSGGNEFLSTEALNLIPRRHLPFRIIDKTRAHAGAFDGLKAIVYTDHDPPDKLVREALAAFTAGGGGVISPIPSAGLAPHSPPIRESHPRFVEYASGNGRIAVAREEISDPYLLAADAHTLLSRANDLIRVWNGGPANSYYTSSPDGHSALVQIVSYIRRPVSHISLGVLGSWRAARLWTLDSRSPYPLRNIAQGEWTEMRLPPLAVYGAVELEK